MPFSRAPFRTPARVRTPVTVFAVGRRVYVAGAARATLTDEANKPLASLSEGAEVTILAWRPGWAGTTRDSIRVTDSGLEGWLPAADLRGTKTAIPPAPAAPPPPAVHPAALRGASRRFGQRS